MSSLNRGQNFRHDEIQKRGHSALLSLCIAAFLISGCGFEPLYGRKGEAAPATLGGVSVDHIGGGRMSQQFKAELEDHLNPRGVIPANPAYRLSVTLSSAASAIGVARDGTVSRYNVNLVSGYVLVRIADGKQVVSGSLNHVGSYNNVTDAYFSTYIAEQKATKEGLKELAELYRHRLAAYLVAPETFPDPEKEPEADPLLQPEVINPDGTRSYR